MMAGDTVDRLTLAGHKLRGKVLYVHAEGTHARVRFVGRAIWDEDIRVGELTVVVEPVSLMRWEDDGGVAA